MFPAIVFGGLALVASAYLFARNAAAALDAQHSGPSEG